MITRHYTKGDEVQIAKLFEDVFHQTMTVEQWKWKYTGQGLHDNKSAVIANDEGLIVGHFGGISLRMWFRDRFTIAYQGTDLMVHKNYRGPLNKRGLYFEIGRFFYENLPSFVYGFINPDHFRLGKLLGFFEDAIVVNDHRLDTASHLMPVYSLERMEWDNRKIDSLWNKVYKGLGWSIVRDREFLKWRYESNPVHSYRLYGLRRRFLNEVLGWVVVREGEESELFLTDMICRDDYLGPMLKKLSSMAYAEGKKEIVLWLNDRYNKLLHSLGVKSFRRGTYIPNCVWVRRCETSEMRTQLYFTMGDADFR